MRRISTKPDRPHAILCALIVGLLLSACNRDQQTTDVAGTTVAGTTADPYAGGKSYPWSDRLETGQGDPYAGGRSYAWTGHQATSGLGKLSAMTNPLSDLTWTSASSAWGPAEKDRSNGEQLAGDGRALTIGGQVFQKGLGVHAGSELRYTLGGFCTEFSASVGIDDEVGNRGSASFQLWNGAALLYDSDVLRGSDAARAVNVNVGGVQTLRLVVTDGGDGIDYDHADWADAAVTCAATAPATLDYQPAAAQPYPVSEAQGLALNGQIYVFGGFDVLRGFTPTDRASRFDPATDRWTALPSMPGRGVTHAGMTSDGASIYYAGGYIADSSGNGQIFGTAAAWQYDVTQGSYSRLPDLPAESAAGQLQVLGGKLHYFGGLDLSRTRDLSAHYVLDLSNRAAWTLAAPMPQPRNHFGSVVLGGKIYAVGGQTGTDEGLSVHNETFVYDPAQDAWTQLRSLPVGRGHISGSTFVMGGRLIVAGGETAHTVASAEVSAYDPGTDTWTALTPLPQPRSSAVAAALDGQTLMFTGGTGSGGFQAGGWKATLR